MSIDFDKMKGKLERLQNKGGGRDNFLKLQDGETILRIIPTPDGDPFKDFWFHYNLKDSYGKPVAGFLSPKKNFGEDDPLDRFVRSLFDEGTDDSIKQAKNLMARQRFFSPVVVRGEEHKGVQIWGYGKMVYEKLLNLVLNPEYGDITDPESGTDLVIHYGRPAGAQFPQTEVTPRRQSSELCDQDSDRAVELLESVPEFDGLFDRKTPDEVGSILDQFLLSADEAEQHSDETRKYTAKTDVSSVDDAFSELLGT